MSERSVWKVSWTQPATMEAEGGDNSCCLPDIVKRPRFWNKWIKMGAQDWSGHGGVMLLRFAAACSRERIEAQIVSCASCLVSHWSWHTFYFASLLHRVSWEFYEPPLSSNTFFFSLRWSLKITTIIIITKGILHWDKSYNASLIWIFSACNSSR